MRIAVVHPYPVDAQAVGGVTRVYELVRFLARRHQVSIFTHADDGRAEVHAPGAERGGDGVRRQAFPRPAASPWRKLRSWLDPVPYYVHRNANPALTAALAAADAEEGFDVVHLELGYMAPLLAGVGSQAVRVLAEQEAIPLVLERLGHVPWRERTRYERLAAQATEKAKTFDAATLPQFDLLYGITPREAEYLSETARRSVAVLPHVVPVARFAAAEPGGEESRRVLFVGNFAHRPNVHAVSWFLDEAWPQVREAAPGAVFEVVGRGLPHALGRRLAASGAEVRGYVEDLPGCYRRADVVVTPVHSGGGMRGKVLEAFASARAVVATPLALEGIEAVPGVHCFSASDPQSFAGAVVQYLRSPELRRGHGGAARRLVSARYDAPVVFARLERDYEKAVERRQGRIARRAQA